MVPTGSLGHCSGQGAPQLPLLSKLPPRSPTSLLGNTICDFHSPKAHPSLRAGAGLSRSPPFRLTTPLSPALYTPPPPPPSSSSSPPPSLLLPRIVAALPPPGEPWKCAAPGRAPPAAPRGTPGRGSSTGGGSPAGTTYPAGRPQVPLNSVPAAPQATAERR